jgi:uncharacterized protein YggU (UPF0235/DUF167 family)
MRAAAEQPWRVADGRVLVRVRVTPGSSEEAILGLEATASGPALKARVRAAPEAGKANAALARLVARWLDLPRSAVAVTSGGSSRVKTLAIAADPALIAPRLAARAADLEHS